MVVLTANDGNEEQVHSHLRCAYLPYTVNACICEL